MFDTFQEKKFKEPDQRYTVDGDILITHVKLPKHFFPDSTIIKHLQISQSNIQELHDDCLLPLKPHLESFSLVSGRLKEIPQKAFKGLNKLIALDLEANAIVDLPSYSFYGLHLIKLNMKGNQIQKVSDKVNTK
ncbi:unnamed protein product [Diabrotica balteata]|uniref:Uncharacterized protein n=1 Tax=Diabrotica balteata TaxID=107213 RepID=A0A9N9T4X5_DIABA|nr:unnamed protein product [Diabrotica balteata]